MYCKRKSLLSKLLRKSMPTVKGIYIYGGVGRGKSMLMDLFYEQLALKQKRRVHFHAFMQEVHVSLYEWRKKHNEDPDAKDPIEPLAQKICHKTKILCFDEFQVTDIADAMLLGRLFEAIIANGTTVIVTSNSHPDDLYKDGLQREAFLPFIEFIKQHVDIAELDAEKDYRLSHLKALSTVYFTPIGPESESFLEEAFLDLIHHAPAHKTILTVHNRTIELERTHGMVAYVSFDDLCKEALGAADYIEIASEFSTLLLSDIPKFTAEDRNEARRFTLLIDELYEHKVKLICSASTPPDQLYHKQTTENARTVSRLMEMQSIRYMQEAHVA